MTLNDQSCRAAVMRVDRKLPAPAMETGDETGDTDTFGRTERRKLFPTAGEARQHTPPPRAASALRLLPPSLDPPAMPERVSIVFNARARERERERERTLRDYRLLSEGNALGVGVEPPLRLDCGTSPGRAPWGSRDPLSRPLVLEQGVRRPRRRGERVKADRAGDIKALSRG